MIKTFIFIFICVFMIPSASMAETSECTRGELQFEFDDVQHETRRGVLTGRLHGTVNTPHPGYHYVLEAEQEHQGDMTRWSLYLNQNEGDIPVITVLGSLNIDEKVRVLDSSKGVFIDVIKPFNWGPEYFTAKFDDGEPHCMQPEMYK